MWYNKLRNAARIPIENNEKFTEEDFFEIMPQFQKVETKEDSDGNSYELRVSLIPTNPLNIFLEMANSNILKSVWFEKWKYACALYTAHYTTLYLKSYKESSPDIQTATEGAGGGNISSISLGDTSISYDNSAFTTAGQEWGLWATTPYGQQLITEAKLLGKGGLFII